MKISLFFIWGSKAVFYEFFDSWIISINKNVKMVMMKFTKTSRHPIRCKFYDSSFSLSIVKSKNKKGF